MTIRGRVFGALAVMVAGVWLSGCMAQDPGKQLPVSQDTPFVLNVPNLEPRPTTRGQAPMEDLPPPQQQQLPAAPPGQAGATSSSGIIPVSNTTRTIKLPATVRVMAWVNNQPIFQDEVFNIVLPQIMRIPASQREEKQAEFIQRTLDGLIDSELIMQDALRKLEKNEKFLEQLKAKAGKEFTKQVNLQMRQQQLDSMEELKIVLQKQGTTMDSFRRMVERQYIADEYTKVCIFPIINKIGNDDIRKFYETHINEFVQLDRVKWQDIFIAVGPKHPTMKDAKEFAQRLGQRWSAGEEIGKLLEFDDGQAASLKGAGVGENKGDIRPLELEPYLFAMRDGEFGPLVELTTGVHVFRLLKRDMAGPMPLDEPLQLKIGNMLKNQAFEQERKSMIRKLRETAVIDMGS